MNNDSYMVKARFLEDLETFRFAVRSHIFDLSNDEENIRFIVKVDRLIDEFRKEALKDEPKKPVDCNSDCDNCDILKEIDEILED